MTVGSIIISLIIFIVLVFGLFFWSIEPKKHLDLSFSDIKRHFKRCCETLKDNGYVSVYSNFSNGEVSITRKNYKTKPDILELKITAGNHSREILQEIQNKVIDSGYDIKITHTKKKKLIQRLFFRFEINDSFTPIKIVKIFEHLFDSYGFKEDVKFKIVDHGPFTIQSQSNSISYKIGYYIGYLVGLVKRFQNKS